MFTRHLKKFNNAAEITAALEAGIIASPYIAFDSSENVVNMTIPYERVPANIDYEEEQNPTVVPVTLGTISVTHRGQYGYLCAQINLPLTFNDSTAGTPKALVVEKSNYDNNYSAQVTSGEMTEGEFNAYLFNHDPDDRFVHPGSAYYTYSVYDTDYPFGTEVMWVTGKAGHNDGEFIRIPTEGSSQYVILVAQADYSTNLVDDTHVYNLGTYTLLPALTDNPAVVFESIQQYACDRIPGPTNNEQGCWIRVAPNTVYDSVRYAGYIEGDCNAAEAIDGSVSDIRDASITAATNWNMSDENPFTFVKVSDANLGSFAFRLYNAATGAVSGTTYTNCFYVE